MKSHTARYSAAIAALFVIGAAACDKGRAYVGPGEDACGSCASAFANGGVPCGDSASSDAYDDLLDCACGACGVECSLSLCAASASDSTCGKCLKEKCEAEHETCAAN